MLLETPFPAVPVLLLVTLHQGLTLRIAVIDKHPCMVLDLQLVHDEALLNIGVFDFVSHPHPALLAAVNQLDDGIVVAPVGDNGRGLVSVDIGLKVKGGQQE